MGGHAPPRWMESMNYELFTAFVLITMALIITPGPIVTFLIATGATYGGKRLNHVHSQARRGWPGQAPPWRYC